MRFIRTVENYPVRLIAVASAGMLAFGVAGCGTLGGGAPKQTMLTSAENSSGEGTVEAKADDNGNTKVEVRVKHVANPSKVAADASIYVVWIKPRDAEVQNVGALQVDEDLTGKLETTTPHAVFTLTVTPEPSARMAAPTHKPIFTAEVNRAQ